MLKNLSISHVSSGLAAILVGYTCSVVLVIEAAMGAGATPVQVGSWLFAIGVASGLTSIFFSMYYKVPVLTAWSTPGAALLASSVAGFSLSETIGACIITALLIIMTGATKSISNFIQKIPTALTTAMLAGILIPFGIKTFTPWESTPVLFGSMFVAYLLGKRFYPRYTMLLLIIVGGAVAYFQGALPLGDSPLSITGPVFMSPTWSIASVVSLSIPLFLVTMVSQNIPGIVMIQSHGYSAPFSRLLLGTGFMNLITAPFGGFTCNLAAISAGICMGEEVDPNPKNRYLASASAGMFYLLAGLFSTSLVALFVAMPSELTQMLAGFALLGIIQRSLFLAMQEENTREGALITLLVTASGISFIGINAPVWGLLAGYVMNRFFNPANEG
ncbi:benzoate/H(+) symporter BenE family transporter [Halodesulfovibrio spirochaetisodalis]|uniref:Benzoate transporter n=1 Tax=Halodesulfovibrio spirochaetisodalis TaxID=1560234 RepID=A0A1B7XD86_9BACT|nr:benzoate/H(+) symporter BenE family transporter [Halodesulfovibrio spirochaetisodalis]OBQ51901.1 benzoate transporter [Halodesulfovibrio spirochaetisodalis]